MNATGMNADSVSVRAAANELECEEGREGLGVRVGAWGQEKG